MSLWTKMSWARHYTWVTSSPWVHGPYTTAVTPSCTPVWLRDSRLLPINGADPARRVAGNLNAAEAVWLASQLPNSLTIPGHYHMFEFNSVEPEEFVSLAEKHAIQYKVLAHGELLTLVK